ncbi:uncharacterized protein N7498_001592, partial [Penicillium cinerascens]
MDDPTSTPAPPQKRPRVAEENRKRAVRACDGCRRVKEKCEGGVPCRRCLRYRRQCNFTHIDPDEKGRASSVSLLERAASINRHEIAEAERVHYMERILSFYVPNITFDIQSLRKAAEDLKSKRRDSESDAGSTRMDANELEDLAIDEEDFTIKALPGNTTRKSSSPVDAIRQKIDEWMKTAAPDATTEVEPFEERWRATQLQSGSSLVSASITCLPPRYVAEFLVQIFFKYAQTNNFYVEEDWLCEKLNICYTNPSSLSSDDAGAVCSILMVLAVGTQFAHMESPTPVNCLPLDSAANQDHHFSEDEVGLTFYQFASKLLPDIIATASVRSVQACLLIGTYLLPLDTSGLCYTYFGLALKLAIQNGMHRRYHGEGLSPRMVEARNRVFWTAYTIEKRISILHGRPASLSDADVDAPFPVDFPGLMPATQPSNHTNMIALITLTLKLGEVSNEITFGCGFGAGYFLIKIMSMGVGSARSAVSVIEALERAIRRLEVWSESHQSQSNGGSPESAYDRFKNWEMLWKTGPVSPLTMAHWKQQEADAVNNSPARQGVPSHASDPPSAADHVIPGSFWMPIPSPPPQLAHWGFDHFVSNFPQELGEFTAIPCFETDTQGNSQGMAGTDMKPPR